MDSLAPSLYAPKQVALALKAVPVGGYTNVVSCVFPLVFSIAPISESSVDPMRIFCASIYSPLGTRRSSTLLFMRPLMKFRTRFAIT